MALEGKSIEEIYEALTIEDIQRAADLFRPIYDRLEGGDGFVSLEVSPKLAHDTAGTITEARHLWTAVNRPNLLIKVPGTREGLPAIQQLIGEGINVNVTLLFGLPRYREVAEAYLVGLETLAAHGKPLTRIASVASFFLSRIDVLIDPMLEKIRLKRGPVAEIVAGLHGQVAIASAKVAYQIYQEIFGSERFQKLSRQGCSFPTSALGEHQHEEPGIQRCKVCRNVDRPRDDQHDPPGNPQCLSRSWQTGLAVGRRYAGGLPCTGRLASGRN